MNKKIYLYCAIVVYFVMNFVSFYLIDTYKANNMIGLVMLAIYLSINIYFVWMAIQRKSYYLYVLLLYWILNLMNEYSIHIPETLRVYVNSLVYVAGSGLRVIKIPNVIPVFGGMSLDCLVRIIICMLFIVYIMIYAVKITIFKRENKIRIERIQVLVILFFIINFLSLYLVDMNSFPIYLSFLLFLLYIVMQIYFIKYAIGRKSYFILLLLINWVVNLMNDYVAYMSPTLRYYIKSIGNVSSSAWRVFELPSWLPRFYYLPLIYVLRAVICICFIAYIIRCLLIITFGQWTGLKRKGM